MVGTIHVKDRARIGIIGDYDADYAVHRATNAALDAGAENLASAVDYDWIATDSVTPGDADRLIGFDGIWAAPGGPYHSLDGALWGIRLARERGIPFVGT